MAQASSARQVLKPDDTSVTPLRYWTDTEQAAMAQRFSGRYEGWCRDWMSRPDFFELSPVRVSIAPALSARLNVARALLPLHAQGAAVPGAPRAWIGLPLPFGAVQSASIAQLSVRMVFSEAAKADTASGAAELALAALANLMAVARAVTGIPEAATDESALQSDLPHDEFHTWAGCVKLSLPASGDVAIYLNGMAARNLLGAGNGERSPTPVGGLTPLQEAVGSTAVGLNLRFNSVDLTVGQLKSLQVGDVVILPHSVEEPLCAVNASDELLFKGYLGRSGERRALQVVRAGAPAGKPAA